MLDYSRAPPRMPEIAFAQLREHRIELRWIKPIIAVPDSAAARFQLVTVTGQPNDRIAIANEIVGHESRNELRQHRIALVKLLVLCRQ